MTAGHGHTHTSELARWDQVHPGATAKDVSPQQALADLLVAAVHAAVVAPESELKRWFSWQWYWDDATVDELVREGRLVRVESNVSAPGTPSRRTSNNLRPLDFPSGGESAPAFRWRGARYL